MLFWQRDDIIEKFNLSSDLDSVHRIRAERMSIFEKPSWAEKVDAIRQIPSLSDLGLQRDALKVELDRDAIAIGQEADLRAGDVAVLENAFTRLMPWRKGPFQLFGQEIDAEWRSDRKWNRIREHLGDLTGKRILDLGCGNGYYMLRVAAQHPQFVLGLDPAPFFYLQFEMFQQYLQDPKLQIDLFGHEQLFLFQKTFDVVMCMGVIYHHANPIDLLRQIRKTLRVGGKALIETQAIPGDNSVALFPKERYAKARNVFFVPTIPCLKNWMTRAGFDDVQLASIGQITFAEQRKTKYMQFESLKDFLDPENLLRTVEGYPAPLRVGVTGTRTKE